MGAFHTYILSLGQEAVRLSDVYQAGPAGTIDAQHDPPLRLVYLQLADQQSSVGTAYIGHSKAVSIGGGIRVLASPDPPAAPNDHLVVIGPTTEDQPFRLSDFWVIGTPQSSLIVGTVGF